jgi:signal transduction histidine kinase
LLLLGELFPFLAHEIRNPLHAIGGALTIIQKRTKTDPLIEQSINVIHDEIKRLNNFVKECLEFSNPSDPSRLTSTDINDIITSSFDLMTPVFQDLSKNIDISLSLQEDLPKIKTNFNQIKQVFLNIIKNSVEAIENKGTLMVKTSYNPKYSKKFLTIEFSDNGKGIKDEISKKIFDPFVTNKVGGTGLGLAVCKKIICENHNGTIDIQSKEGKGTTVIIKLPVGDSSRIL